MPSFVVGLLSGKLPEWTDDEWQALATDRRAQRSTRRHLELPPGFDAALHVIASQRLMEAGRTDDAMTLVRFAVEELPGNKQLLAWEAALEAGETFQLNLNALRGQAEPDAGAQEETPSEPSNEDARRTSTLPRTGPRVMTAAAAPASTILERGTTAERAAHGWSGTAA